MMGRTIPWQGLFAYGDLFALYLNQISDHNPPVKPDSSGKQGKGFQPLLCSVFHMVIPQCYLQAPLLCYIHSDP